MALLSGLLSGCIFSPDKGKDPPVVPPPPYPVLSTPQKVLETLELCYARRDSSKYLSLLDGQYSATSYDADPADGNQPGLFTRADEEQHIKNLAENLAVTVVELELGSEGVWRRRTTLSDDGLEEWAEISVYNPTVVIYEGLNSTALLGNETLTFKFRFRTPAPTSPSDTLWTIVRWIEDAP